ncbi:hypothetical protein Tco_0561990 [Tanacetum coccineum]
MEAHLAPKPFVQVKKLFLHVRFAVVPTTLNIAWKILSKLLSIMHPHVSTKPEVLKVPAYAPMYNALLDKYVESLEFGKIESAFISGEMPKKMKDPKLFILPFRLGESKPFETLADLRNCEKRKGRGFLAAASAIIDCKKAKIAIEDGITRSLDPLFEDYIELNDLNEPFKIRINQGDDLMPTIEEGEVIEEFITMDNEIDIGIDDYPSYYNYDKKIHIDFLENIDAYRDEGMGDVIIGEPFLREVGIKTRRFKGMITIYNGNDEVSKEDEMNGISHAYQKLKGFYKGVLNLGPDYIQDAKTEEWLTRPRERNIDEYWWRIYKSGDLEVLKS